MPEERPPPPLDSEPVIRDDESSPKHRVVWDQGPLGPPVRPPHLGGITRATVRMVRPSLSGLAPAAAPSEAIVEQPVDSVVEMVPTTARVPNAPQRPASTRGREAPVVAPRVRASGSRSIDPRLVLLTAPDSARAASFRLLRDNLIAKGLPRVLAVSSPATNDGKTTCALNLALALAEHTMGRILLMDGNFFEPSLATIFAVDEHTPSPDVLDPLRLAPYKLAELTPSLHVAALAPRRGEPAACFDKQRFDMLLDLLCRVGYDHIIVDAPALVDSPMVSQLLGGVDGVLLAVRAGRTTARALRRAVEEIPGNKGLGVALIDAQPHP